MNRILLFMLPCLCQCQLNGQQVKVKDCQPLVESLAGRRCPDWFGNAKLGIFVHWGLYSVPGWATPTTTPDKVTDWPAFYRSNPYAEWYLNSLRIKGSPTWLYHKEKYGESFDYYNFRDTLIKTSVNWYATSWADIFSNTGARYVVFGTKHHDGFTLWPSAVPNPFMTKDKINSQRDFTGELQQAIREKGLKFGVYYSGGLDWTFNPLPVTNLWPDLFESMPPSSAYTAYADSHMLELIHRYKPDILWNDVNYPKDGNLNCIFSELFNLNPEAVFNDRWGQHPVHSDFITPEYVVFDSTRTQKWESCRGIGYSFGYNRMEDDRHLLSSAELISLLIDVVSKNGNLLLNVGPKGDGTIPENQMKRLVDLGRWMDIHKDGIYDTRPWKIPGLTLADGTRLRFTYKNHELYVFILDKPKDPFLFIPFALCEMNSTAWLYGNPGNRLSISHESKGMHVTLPEDIDFQFPRMLKIAPVSNW